jgi:acyl carrier protein
MTECNVALWYECPPDAPFEAAPLGEPVAGLDAATVDGELVVAGAHVALGYAGQPELTAERFGTDGGRRRFTTHDLVERGAGGFAYRGRSDDNVKVRGYSVQLGAVEHVLSGHPSVRESAVLVRSYGVSDQRLEAAVVLRAPVGPGELAGHLRAELPAYMVPGVVRELPALPRLPNGKLDRQALLEAPEPPVRADDGPQWTAEARELMAGALAVPVDGVGPDSDFFDLGGHSLLLLRLAAEIERRHGVQLELDELLARATPAELGELLAQRAPTDGGVR